MLKLFFAHSFRFDLWVNMCFWVLNSCENLVFLCVAMIIGLILHYKTKILLNKIDIGNQFEKSVFSY